MPKTEPISSAWLSYRPVVKVLSYLSAAWCGALLVVIGSMTTAVLGNQVFGFLTKSSAIWAELVGQAFALVGMGYLIVLMPGLAFGRFLLRALPPNLSNQGRGQWHRAIIIAFLLSVPFVAVVIFMIVLNSAGVAMDKASTISQPHRTAMLIGNIFTSIPCFLLWATGAFGPLVRHHRKPRSFLEQPFVLFLRRFSTFSDRAVIAMVLKQAKPGLPVVFLTPTASQPGDWDPFLVGFAGLKMTRPWRSVPIVLRARDDDWRVTANELILRARTILIDTTDTSDAIRGEIEMIERAGRWSDTVCLRLREQEHDHDVGSSDDIGKARVIDYTKSWVRAIPTMIIGIPVVLMTILGLGAAAAFLLKSEWLKFVSPSIVVFGVLFYLSVFVRPTINRAAKAALKKILRPATLSRVPGHKVTR